MFDGVVADRTQAQGVLHRAVKHLEIEGLHKPKDLDVFPLAVSVYVLVAIVKKRLDLDASLYTLLQILSVTLFEKMPIHQALAGDENRCNASQITNQLNLFDF